MNIRGRGLITLPRRAVSGLALLPWCKEVNRCLQELRDRTFSVNGTGKGRGGKRLPFDVELFNSGTAEAPAWKVRIHPGYINERLPGAGTDATDVHAVGNQYSEEDPDRLNEFAVIEGDGVYVAVSVLPDGTVGVDSEEDPPPDPVTFEIYQADPGPDDIHYQPKVDDETSDGAPGTYYYKLAEIQAPDAEGGSLRLKRFLSGSHISHFQELPSIRTTTGAGTGIGVIPKKWDNTGRNYALRALTKGLGGLGITTEADLVEVRGNKKALDIRFLEGDTELTADDIDFRDGLTTRGVDIVGDETPLPDADNVTVRLPTVVERQTGTPQISVAEIGAAGRIYEVSGNGVDAYLNITVNGDPGVQIDWADGLMTSANQTLDIATSTVPDGSQGDMLYWNVVAGIGSWTLLPAPAAPTSPNRNFLTHDGTVPAWVEMEAKEISICESGTPVTKTIYVDI